MTNYFFKYPHLLFKITVTIPVGKRGPDCG